MGLERPLEQMLCQVRPQMVLGPGLTLLRNLQCLETFAVNADDAELPDNTNLILQAPPIQTDGPAALRTTTDLMPIAKRLHELQLLAEISYRAATYICNHGYYRALHLITQEQLAARCVFLHVPMIEEGELVDATMQHHWQLAELRLAFDTVLEE